MKYVLILVLFSSCSTLKINGIPVKNSHKKVVSNKEIALIGVSIIGGYYIGNNVIKKPLK